MALYSKDERAEIESEGGVSSRHGEVLKADERKKMLELCERILKKEEDGYVSITHRVVDDEGSHIEGFIKAYRFSAEEIIAYTIRAFDIPMVEVFQIAMKVEKQRP